MKKLALSLIGCLAVASSALAFNYKLPQPITVTQTVDSVEFYAVNFGTVNFYDYATNQVTTTNIAVTGLPDGSTATNQWYSTNLLVTATATNTEFYAEAPYVWHGADGKMLQQGSAKYTQANLVSAMGQPFLTQCSNLVSSLGAGVTMQGQIQLLGATGTNRLLVTCQYQTQANGVAEQGLRQLNEAALVKAKVDPNILVQAILTMTAAAVHSEPAVR